MLNPLGPRRQSLCLTAWAKTKVYFPGDRNLMWMKTSQHFAVLKYMGASTGTCMGLAKPVCRLISIVCEQNLHHAEYVPHFWSQSVKVMAMVMVMVRVWLMRYALCAMRYALCAMGYALWAMGYGLWAMGYGLWAMGYGLWVMGYGYATYLESC